MDNTQTDARNDAQDDAQDDARTLGFIGVGSIAGAMVEGLLGGGGDGSDGTVDGADTTPTVILSPRGRDTVARLRAAFPQVIVAESNADVVAQSDVVVLAVRPDQLREALDGAEFREGQAVVSVLAGVPVSAVQDAVGRTDIPVARAIPLPPVAERGIVVPVTAGVPEAVDLFNRLGGTLVVPDEEQIAVLSAVTGSCTGLLQYISSLCDWSVGKGLDRTVAEPFIRGMVASLSPALLDDGESMGDVIASHETPGGLNEQLRTGFFDAERTGALFTALDGLHTRAAG